jgi:hypothetical protein
MDLTSPLLVLTDAFMFTLAGIPVSRPTDHSVEPESFREQPDRVGRAVRMHQTGATGRRDNRPRT